jgi:hypothetical protein
LKKNRDQLDVRDKNKKQRAIVKNVVNCMLAISDYNFEVLL